MRSFVAIELPGGVRQRLWELGQSLRASGLRASWVKPERMHLTLRFLGDVAQSDLDDLGALLATGYAGRGPLKLGVKGTGAFPNVRRPSVIWAGIEALAGGLTEVQAVAEDASQRIGLAPEKRGFKPHLTLARLKDHGRAEELPALLSKHADFALDAFQVTGVSLFSSELTASGPNYTRLREFPF